MNPYATVLAQTQLEELRTASAQRRLLRASRSDRPGRLARAKSSIIAAITSPDASPTFLPNLTDYPYRG